MAIVVPLFIKAGRYEQEKKRSANETSEWSNLRAVIVSQGIRRIDRKQMGVCLSARGDLIGKLNGITRGNRVKIKTSASSNFDVGHFTWGALQI